MQPVIRSNLKARTFPDRVSMLAGLHKMSGHEPFGPQPPPGVPYPSHAAGYPHIPQQFIQPVRKDKTLLYVGLGCAGIVLIFVLSLVGLGIWGYFKAKSAIESAAQKFEHMRLTPGVAGTSVSPECELAVRCCQRVMGKLKNEPEYQKCETFLDSPSNVCQPQLEAFTQAAKNLNISCESAAAPLAAPSGSESTPVPAPAKKRRPPQVKSTKVPTLAN